MIVPEEASFGDIDAMGTAAVLYRRVVPQAKNLAMKNAAQAGWTDLEARPVRKGPFTVYYDVFGLPPGVKAPKAVPSISTPWSHVLPALPFPVASPGWGYGWGSTYYPFQPPTSQHQRIGTYMWYDLEAAKARQAAAGWTDLRATMWSKSSSILWGIPPAVVIPSPVVPVVPQPIVVVPEPTPTPAPAPVTTYSPRAPVARGSFDVTLSGDEEGIF